MQTAYITWKRKDSPSSSHHMWPPAQILMNLRLVFLPAVCIGKGFVFRKFRNWAREWDGNTNCWAEWALLASLGESWRWSRPQPFFCPQGVHCACGQETPRFSVASTCHWFSEKWLWLLKPAYLRRSEEAQEKWQGAHGQASSVNDLQELVDKDLVCLKLKCA